MDEEKTIELNINLDRPVIITILLTIILVESVYLFYGGFSSPETESEPEINFNMPDEEPETVDELLYHFEVIGFKNVIEWDVQYWSGKHLELEYIDALKLAKESPFVGYNKGFVAFIILNEGNLMIWMKD
ncbi:MAG: hypothetical protein JSV27_12140 [Candidatus Bathyarchaeota archaeon]|nr:MAG: hypothetical protein JSV27_12140 [Candidatus Bathyarchaeota archaeon]